MSDFVGVKFLLTIMQMAQKKRQNAEEAQAMLTIMQMAQKLRKGRIRCS